MSTRQAIRAVLVCLGSLGLTGAFLVAPASAHVVPAASVVIDCESVRFDFSYFPPGPAELAITITQGDDVIDVNGVTGVSETEGSVYVPIALTGNGPVEVEIAWDVDGGGSTFAEGSLDCAPVEPETPVVPEVVPEVPVPTELVPAAVETAPVTPVEVLAAPTAVAATPVAELPMTGRNEVAAEVLAGCLLLAAGFVMIRRYGAAHVVNALCDDVPDDDVIDLTVED